MKHVLSMLALLGAVTFGAPAWAQETAAAPAVVEAAAAVVEVAAEAAAAVAEAAAPKSPLSAPRSVPTGIPIMAETMPRPKSVMPCPGVTFPDAMAPSPRFAANSSPVPGGPSAEKIDCPYLSRKSLVL